MAEKITPNCPEKITFKRKKTESVADFALRIKRECNYFYNLNWKYKGKKVELNTTHNKYGEISGLDHIMTDRNTRDIDFYNEARIETLKFLEILFSEACYNCNKIKIRRDLTHKTRSKGNYRINICCEYLKYMVTLEYNKKKDNYLIITAYLIKQDKFEKLFKNGKESS